MISFVNPRIFVLVLERFRGEDSTVFTAFPLEYFAGDGFIKVYKQVDSKVYGTVISFDEGGMTKWRGNDLSREQVLHDLIENEKGITLLSPIES